MTYLLVPLLITFIIVALILLIVHLGFRAPRNREIGSPNDFGIDFKEAVIPTVSEKKLFAWLLPVENSNETIILLHGWGGNAELMLPIGLPFHRAGLNVLLIDTRNHGNSDSGSVSSMPRFAEDLDSSINWLKKYHPDKTSKIALLGHSVGAGAVLLEASKRNDIHAVMSVSAFAHPEWMMKRHLKKIHMPDFIIWLIFRYIEWVIGRKFQHIAPMNTVCHIRCPVLLVHGKEDFTVPIEDARAIITNCPESHISLIEIDGAGHDSVDKIEENAARLISFLQQSDFSCVSDINQS
ncbi:MAG: alpha/beta fold hydrolase [Gammaproteobacteria bacterium]|nr:alpha/beta fold hydrolase [Gammaproteobacteria bacterium]